MNRISATEIVRIFSKLNGIPLNRVLAFELNWQAEGITELFYEVKILTLDENPIGDSSYGTNDNLEYCDFNSTWKTFRCTMDSVRLFLKACGLQTDNTVSLKFSWSIGCNKAFEIEARFLPNYLPILEGMLFEEVPEMDELEAGYHASET